MIGRKKKIVLYSPQLADERRGIPSRKDVLPLSVLTIAAWPLADGYDVVIIDGSLYPQEVAHQRVLEACEGALVYGTTGILGYQVADAFLCTTKVAARFPDLKRIIGGWFASVAPELQLETGLYDAVCLGQGELTFREFIQAVEAGESLTSVRGLALWRDGAMVMTEHRKVVGWAELLNCPWELLDFEEYRAHQLRQTQVRLTERLPRPPTIPEPEPYVGMAYFGSFGCPEPCAFCCSPGVTDLRWKGMPAERMLDDIQELQSRWGFDVVRFHDANFGVMEKRSREFAEGILNRGMKLAWFPMIQAFSFKRYAEATIDAMAESGMYVVNVGAETGSEEMMKVIGKHTRKCDNYDAAMLLGERGVMAWMTYIIGYPHETRGSMFATLDQARRIRADCPHSHPAVWPYHPIPGTPMYEQAKELGFQPPETLVEWGDFFEYHLANAWPDRIPEDVARRRKLFQHYATLSHGLARGKIGFWERRAQQRLKSGDYTFARAEAKAFDLVHKLSRAFRRGAKPAAVAWETGDGVPATPGGAA